MIVCMCGGWFGFMRIIMIRSIQSLSPPFCPKYSFVSSPQICNQLVRVWKFSMCYFGIHFEADCRCDAIGLNVHPSVRETLNPVPFTSLTD